MRKKIYKYLLIGVVAGISVFLIFLYVRRPEKTPIKTASTGTPLQVRVAVVEEKDVPRYLLLTGELRAEKESSVATDAAGIVVLASIERGVAVKKGDVLVQLDDRNAILAVREADANLKSARADYEHAKKDLERNEQLAKAKAVSDSSLQKSKAAHDISAAALSVAEVRLDKAEKNLADCTVSAPFTGFVAERKMQIGEYVQAGTVVARLVEVDTLRLSLNVPETAVGGLYVGQEVSFTVGAYPDRTFPGNVKHVGAAVRDNSRDLVIEAEIANSDRLLKPGMFASAKLVLTSAINTVVPGNAIRTEGINSHVFVVQDGHAVEKLVEIGVSVGDSVEIRSGLKPGEKVVLDPGAGLKDGTQIRM